MYRVLITAIVGLTIIEGIALSMHINGVMMSLTVGAICACAGVHFGDQFCRRSKGG